MMVSISSGFVRTSITCLALLALAPSTSHAQDRGRGESAFHVDVPDDTRGAGAKDVALSFYYKDPNGRTERNRVQATIRILPISGAMRPKDMELVDRPVAEQYFNGVMEKPTVSGSLERVPGTRNSYVIHFNIQGQRRPGRSVRTVGRTQLSSPQWYLDYDRSRYRPHGVGRTFRLSFYRPSGGGGSVSGAQAGKTAEAGKDEPSPAKSISSADIVVHRGVQETKRMDVPLDFCFQDARDQSKANYVHATITIVPPLPRLGGAPPTSIGSIEQGKIEFVERSHQGRTALGRATFVFSKVAGTPSTYMIGFDIEAASWRQSGALPAYQAPPASPRWKINYGMETQTGTGFLHHLRISEARGGGGAICEYDAKAERPGSPKTAQKCFGLGVASSGMPTSPTSPTTPTTPTTPTSPRTPWSPNSPTSPRTPRSPNSVRTFS